METGLGDKFASVSLASDITYEISGLFSNQSRVLKLTLFSEFSIPV